MQGALKYSCVNVFKDKQLGHIKLNIITIKKSQAFMRSCCVRRCGGESANNYYLLMHVYGIKSTGLHAQRF